MANLRVILLLLATGLAPAAAETNPGDQARLEELSLLGYGLANPACVEWNDGCATCRRGTDGAAHCSTPGIACQPAATVCKAP